MPFQKIKISKKKYDRMIDLANLLHNANVTADHFHKDLQREMQRAAGKYEPIPVFIDAAAYHKLIDRYFTTND